VIDDNEIEETEIEESTETEAPADDLRATLEAAFNSQPESSDDSETPSEAAARERDERGRFASKQVKDQATQIEGSEAVEPIAPPYSWSADRKAEFAQLPRQLQEYVATRERERESLIGKKSQEERAIRERYAPVDRIVENYGETFRRANIDPYQGLEHLVLAQQYLDKDPVGALTLMAQSYGIDLSQLAAGSVTPRNEHPQEFHYLTNELQTIRSQLAAIEQDKMAQQQRYAISEVESFANEMDTSGALLRPFMADVHDVMMDEIRLIRSKNTDLAPRQILQQAYETACWKSPEVRARLVEQQTAPHVNAARVAQAKRAGASIKGAPGAGALSSSAGNSIRESLLAAWDQHS